MATLNRFPQRICVTCTPDELRKLADKMEKKILLTELGEDTLVETWKTNEFELMFYFDQEKVAEDFLKMSSIFFKSGDILHHRDGAYEIIRTEKSPVETAYWVWVKEQTEPLFCPISYLYKVKRP